MGGNLQQNEGWQRWRCTGIRRERKKDRKDECRRKLNESRKRDKPGARWLMEFPEWVVAVVGSKRDGCGSPGHEMGVARALLPV